MGGTIGGKDGRHDGLDAHVGQEAQAGHQGEVAWAGRWAGPVNSEGWAEGRVQWATGRAGSRLGNGWELGLERGLDRRWLFD